MGRKFLALSLSLCLVLSSFYEVSCQDQGTTGLNLDLIDQANVNSLQSNEEAAAKRQSDQTSGQSNSTVTDSISLSLSEEPVKDSVDTSAQLGAVTDIEREVEANLNSLKQAESRINKLDESTDDEELDVKRHKMLEAIEREFEAATAGFEKLKINDYTQGKDDEESAKRQRMLDEIERDFEAATKGLEQLKADDVTGGDDEEHAARRQKMLEEIEREFEEATKGLEELRGSKSSTDDDEHSAKRRSMLEEIEREFEAATKGLEELKANDSTQGKDDDEHTAKSSEREFEEATIAKTDGGIYFASGSATTTIGQPSCGVCGPNDGDFGSGPQSSAGECGCFKEGRDGLEPIRGLSVKIKEILLAENFESSETYKNRESLKNVVRTHREETSTKEGSSLDMIKSESAITSETKEGLKLYLKKLGLIRASELVNRPDFDAIIAAGIRYEALSKTSVGFSLIARYRTIIKEGHEASYRLKLAQEHAKWYRNVACKMQEAVDLAFKSTKSVAQEGDNLSIKLLTIKKLVAMIEVDKTKADLKFKSEETKLARLLKEATQAYQQFHVAVRKEKDVEATKELSDVMTRRFDSLWVEIHRSLN